MILAVPCAFIGRSRHQSSQIGNVEQVRIRRFTLEISGAAGFITSLQLLRDSRLNNSDTQQGQIEARIERIQINHTLVESKINQKACKIHTIKTASLLRYICQAINPVLYKQGLYYLR